MADKPGFFGRLKQQLARTRTSLVGGLSSLLRGKKSIDDDLLEELETRLLMADVGIEATTEILANLTRKASRSDLKQNDALITILQEEMVSLLAPCEVPLTITAHHPHMILVVGVNGAGKTTTIGKLAARYKGEGQSVVLAAGDTFRAAAVEQLKSWGERVEVPVVAQSIGADAASVIFDGIQSARARKADLLIADTAGRLHTKSNLMEELKKILRVTRKADESAPHEVLLVLDASTGQNALNQAVQFHESVGVTGLVLTKLDGTAKGGIVFAIAKCLGLPIRFIGVGEGVEDLQPFRAEAFVEALLAEAEPAA